MSTATATHERMTAESYHAHPAHGSSMLEDFRNSRRSFDAWYVAKTEKKPEPSDAMRLGTLLHLRVLQPELFSESVAEPLPELAPDGKKWYRRKGSDHEKWWADELEKRRGKLAASEGELERVECMASAVADNEWFQIVRDRGGEPEFPIFWRDAETGLECKCLVDWFGPISLDMKTSCDPMPEGFSRQAVKLGYHRKRRHYLAGLQHFTGEKEPDLLHVAIGTQWPWLVVDYELDDTDFRGQSLGYKQWRNTLRELAECYSTDDWREPCEKQVVRLGLPRYAYLEDEFRYF